MVDYVQTVDIPHEVWSFFEAFHEFGSLIYRPGARTATFEFSAEDLWDAKAILHEAESALSTYYDVVLTDTRPEEV